MMSISRAGGSPSTMQTSRQGLMQDSTHSRIGIKPRTTRNDRRALLNISEDFNGRHFLKKPDEGEDSPAEDIIQYLDKDNSIALL